MAISKKHLYENSDVAATKFAPSKKCPIVLIEIRIFMEIFIDLIIYLLVAKSVISCICPPPLSKQYKYEVITHNYPILKYFEQICAILFSFRLCLFSTAVLSDKKLKYNVENNKCDKYEVQRKILNKIQVP